MAIAAPRRTSPHVRVWPRWLPVVALTLLAAAVRFPTLRVQSYWYDEALTVSLVRGSFGAMLHSLFAENAEPPPYFILSWLWVRVFGAGEFGLRSLSALLGTLTVPALAAAARVAAGRRAALVTGAIAAFSPLLVWYSQEARAYALLVFLCAVSLLCFLRAAEEARTRDLVVWVLASLLAVGAHYFALFLVVPEAGYLLWRAPHPRRRVRAVAGFAVGLAALAPMLIYQSIHGVVQWIGESSLYPRLGNAGSSFAVGPNAPAPLNAHHSAVTLVAALGFAVVLASALLWSAPRVRRSVALLAALGVIAVAVPIAAALVGKDFVLDRNLMPALLPLTIVVAAGLTVPRLRLAGIAIAAVLCLGYCALDVQVVRDKALQRDDWRGVAQALGPARRDRLVTVSPFWQEVALALYAPLRPTGTPARVQEVDTVTYDGFVPFNSPVAAVPPPPPFHLAGRRRIQLVTVTRYEAPRPVVLRPAAVTGAGPNAARPYLEGP